MVKDLIKELHAPTNSVQAATNKTVAHLLNDQLPDGRWVGALSSSCEPTALAVVTLHLIDQQQYVQQIRRGVKWLIQTQQHDGGWGDAICDPSTIKATTLAISALHLVSPDKHQTAIERGLAWLEKAGGWNAVSVVCAPIAALAGLMPWSRTTDLPYEAILVPSLLRKKTSFGIPGFLAIGLARDAYCPPPLQRRLIRALARPRVVDWLRRVQASNGSFEESVMMNSFVVIGLTAGGIHEASDVVERSLAYILNSQREDGSWPLDRDLEIFITNTVIIALHELGYDLQQPRFQNTIEWLLANQIRAPFYATGAPGGGWAWAMPGGWPDADDTAYALKSLMALGLSPDQPQIQAGIAWQLAMQNKNGAWHTFVVNSNAPFDEPCPYVTAHALSGLWATGLFTANSDPVQRALDWLQRVQGSDGAFHAIWFRNFTSATAAVLETMAEYSLADTPVARRCSDWLLANQNLDGSWGGCKGEPGTAEETGWAIGALLLAGVLPTDQAIEQGIAWLMNRQQPDGTWQPAIIGLYSRSLWYSNSHYAITFPLKALALYLNRMGGIP